MARAGDVIGGKYRLVHALGIGGMGAVWRAEHLALKLQVAIKLLDVRGPTAPQAVARFQREAQIAASIRHRNIVYISDFGADEGMPFLVMELLTGVTLSERLMIGNPMSIGTFLRLMEQTLQALAAVHAAGVVHRDMKPENIFLVRQDAEVVPKLLDFGVSRSLERGQGHTITREGVVMGTPEYVAPEQARGRMTDVRSDLYSLGVVIFEALAGRLPFQADNSADLIAALLNGKPPPLGSLRSDLEAEFSAMADRAIAHKPEERFQTAEEMRRAFLTYLQAHPELDQRSLPRRSIALKAIEPGEAHPPLRRPTPTESEAPPTQIGSSPPEGTRSGRPFAAAGLLAIAGGLGVALAAWQGDHATRAAQARAAPRLEATPAAAAPAMVGEPKAALPEKITVELVGVPSDAQVWIDGALSAGPNATLARDSGIHAIEVRAKGRRTWRLMHDAHTDGRYALSLEPEASNKSSRKEGPKRALGEPNGRPAKLLRTPDF